jgi:poly(A) polymerase
VKLDYAARLKAADWLAGDETQALFGALDGAARRTRAVGGIVRDTLLGRPREAADIDIATELHPEETMRRAKMAGASVYPTGLDHGTVTVKLGDLVAEVTTLREDVETDGRRAQVRFGTDWTRDAGRRDFTLNALYADMYGELFDPLGGVEDCIEGRVRFIGDATKRIEEDRLRVYRFFRFSASHGGEKLDPDGLEACATWSGRLGGLSAERVGGEMRRMLALPRIGATLRAMSEIALLPFDSDTVERLHAYERRAIGGPDSAARLALIADHVGAGQLQRIWRLSNVEIAAATAILAAAKLIAEFRLNEAAYRYPAALAEAIDIAAIQSGWTDAGRAAVMEELRSLEVPRFPIGGDDLIARGFSPGPQLGAEMQRLEQVWIESRFELDRDSLLDRVDSKG